MKLSTKEKAILAHIEFNPDIGAEELSRLTRYSSTSIAYTIRTLRERGVLKLGAIIDFYKLGYTNVGIFFSLRNETSRASLKLKEEICRNNHVAWLGSLGGAYHYGLGFLAAEFMDVHQFLQELGERYDALFATKVIALRMAIYRFSRGFLQPTAKKKEQIMLSPGKATIVVDTLDDQILRFLTTNSYDSIREVARNLGEPVATIERRVRKLKEQKVIARFVYHIQEEALHVQSHRLLLSTQRLSQALKKKLYTYAATHPQVVMFMESVGTWDFEFGVEVENSLQVRTITQELYELGAGELQRVETVDEIEDFKLNYYPFT